MFIFGSTSDDHLAWVMDSNPVHHPCPTPKNEMIVFGLHSTSDYWPGWVMDSNPYEMLIFGLCSTSDDRPYLAVDSNPICHPSSTIKNAMLIFFIMFNF